MKFKLINSDVVDFVRVDDCNCVMMEIVDFNKHYICTCSLDEALVDKLELNCTFVATYDTMTDIVLKVERVMLEKNIMRFRGFNNLTGRKEIIDALKYKYGSKVLSNNGSIIDLNDCTNGELLYAMTDINKKDDFIIRDNVSLEEVIEYNKQTDRVKSCWD